ncbi:hypothetical protein [Actinokineospora sp. NBRC 105648]|uniref:hypothetical protein n=1 Tax=Actinokineospora sp. NBRC 105648 TaxID=3032206 RepID=UPI0024A5681E|nr:hypothetical protein [Actinokineospora sp. NBRC 105648]GLZ41641.1 hypothetical protein Acsp05_52650 [Actinokineospora sp. NBRC 105648]
MADDNTQNAGDSASDGIACALCGRLRSAGTPLEALAWVKDEGNRWLCPECGRRHVRDIEGKLPAEYWN